MSGKSCFAKQKPGVSAGPSVPCHSLLGWPCGRFSPTSPSKTGLPSSGHPFWWRSCLVGTICQSGSQEPRPPNRRCSPPPPQKPHPREMAAKPTDPSPSSPPSPSGGVCAPGLPLCRQQVEYCRCGRLKCRRHNGGLCPIRHARAPLWKAHTRGDTALAPAIMPAA